MNGHVGFRTALASDTELVLSVLDEVAAWLRSRGIQQWPSRFEVAWVSEAIARGETSLVSVNDETAGTYTLDWSDPVWADLDGTAAYLHRIAVRRFAAGLGELILDRAAQTARQQGTNAIRLDCVSSNARLRAYYEARGFVHQGDVTVGGAPGQRDDNGEITTVSRYELELAPRTPTASSAAEGRLSTPSG